ncbi:MAG: alternative ribosome rescue aminoacyl-tRNA hydrolase ArfB [Aestuariibacter sp.]
MMQVKIDESEIVYNAIRAQGAGGQNVNKVASAIHLRFDIRNSSLPEEIKHRLLNMNDSRITDDGVLVIKAQQFRTQEQNREDARQRLQEIVNKAAHVPKKRKATKPTKGSVQRRIKAKKQKSQIKAMRGKVLD